MAEPLTLTHREKQTHRIHPELTTDSRAGEFVDVRKALGLSQADFSRIVHLSPRKISAIENGVGTTERDVSRYNEIQHLRNELGSLMREEAFGKWIKRRVEYLGETPLQAIEAGRSSRVWKMLGRIKDGVPLDEAPSR